MRGDAVLVAATIFVALVAGAQPALAQCDMPGNPSSPQFVDSGGWNLRSQAASRLHNSQPEACRGYTERQVRVRVGLRRKAPLLRLHLEQSCQTRGRRLAAGERRTCQDMCIEETEWLIAEQHHRAYLAALTRVVASPRCLAEATEMKRWRCGGGPPLLPAFTVASSPGHPLVLEGRYREQGQVWRYEVVQTGACGRSWFEIRQPLPRRQQPRINPQLGPMIDRL